MLQTAGTKTAIKKDGGVNIMKKKYLLFTIPTLLALSSCSGIQNSNDQRAFAFQEDTNAHAEIFGGVEESFSFRTKQPLRTMTPGEGSLLQPKIGVQYRPSYQKDKDDDGVPENYIAVRFVAAVTALDVKAIWTRAAYDSDGDRVGVESTVETKKAYVSLSNGGATTTASAQYSGYAYYVVYTVYDIPATGFDDYTLVAHLTLSDPDDDSKFIDSKAVATRFNGDYSVDFAANKTNSFLRKYLPEDAHADVDEDSPTRNDAQNLISFTATIEEDQDFLIVRNDTVNHKFCIYDSSCLVYGQNDENAAVLTSFEDHDGFICAKETGKFALYLNNDGNLYRFLYGASGFYVRGDAAGDDKWGLNDNYQFTACPTEDGNVGVLLNVHLSTAAKGFKIGDSSWNNEWGYWGYKRDGGGYNWRGSGNANIIGGAASNFDPHASEGGDVKNIVCNTAGYYNIYLTNSGYVSFELVSAD